MGLNDFRNEAGEFLTRIGAADQPISKMLQMLDGEIKLLRNSIDEPEMFRHQLYDVLFILFSIASIRGMNLDIEWEKGRHKKKEKYLGEQV
jgi:hypothetical protein